MENKPLQASVITVFEILQAIIPIALAYFSGQLVTDVVKAVSTHSFEPVYGSFLAVMVLGLASITVRPVKSLIDSELRFAVETEVTARLMRKAIHKPVLLD